MDPTHRQDGPPDPPPGATVRRLRRPGQPPTGRYAHTADREPEPDEDEFPGYTIGAAAATLDDPVEDYEPFGLVDDQDPAPAARQITRVATHRLGAGVDQSLAPTSDADLTVDHDDTITPTLAPEPVTGPRPVHAGDDDASSRYATTARTRSHRTRRLRTILILGLVGLTTPVVILDNQAQRSPRPPAPVTTTTPSTRTNAGADTLTRASTREIAAAISKAYITAQATRRTHARHVARRRAPRHHARSTPHRRSPVTHPATAPPATTSASRTVAQSPVPAQSPPSPPVTSPQPSTSATASTAHSSSTTTQRGRSTGASAASLLGGIGSCIKGC